MPMSPQTNRRVNGRPHGTGERSEAHISEGAIRERDRSDMSFPSPNTGLKRVPEDGQRSEGRHSGSMSQESPAKYRVAQIDRYDKVDGFERDDRGPSPKSRIHSWVILVCSKLREC